MIDVDRYMRVLGDELRRVRRGRGLTRKQLQALLDSDISVQTLATYELGTRQCSVVRLAELCSALDVEPGKLIARVEHRLRPGADLVVSVAALVEQTPPELAPLRRWATLSTDASGFVRFRHDMLDRAAELCGMESVELVRHLQSIR